MCPIRLLAIAGLAACLPAQTVVFQNDFEGAVPPELSPGQAFLTGVQGYAGLGPAGNQFQGGFLRCPSGNEVTLTLTGLPAHNAIHLDFLFAAIDSLDGTGSFPGGDFYRVSVDGNPIFRESFANATASQIQSYVSPPGVELARRVDLGFAGPGSYFTDSAYWLGGDPLFADIGHTASTLTITFVMEGPGIQPLTDESWAIDNLRVSVDTVVNPGFARAYGVSCGPVLAATVVPHVGRQLPLLVTGMPASSLLAGCALGLSNTVYNGVPLPLSLAPYGMPGCWLLQDLNVGDAVRLTLFGNTAAAIWIPVPNSSSYVGIRAFFQAWAISPGANPTGAVFSNGLDVQIGG